MARAELKRYRFNGRVFWYDPAKAPAGAEPIEKPKPKKTRKKKGDAEDKAAEPANK